MGLVDVQTLRHGYDGKKEHRNPNSERPSSPQGARIEHGSSEPKSSPNPVNKATSRESLKKTYDANSNRLTTTGTTASTETVSTTNNRLNSTSGGIVRTYSYDNAGNTLSLTGETFTFNQRGRMSSATSSAGTTNYLYNALGQLIEKSGNGGTTLLIYDEAGRLLGEYTAAGALIQETVWMGDTPVATMQPNGSSIAIYYVHTDHLGTPRKITRPSDNGLMWRWDPDTFGNVNPNTNPAGLGAFNYNLRFPGQYSLNESGLYYNYFRDYDPQTGRYLESDPIGLRGGINTYAYTSANPITNVDPSGLASASDEARAAGLIPYPPPLPSPGVSPEVKKRLCHVINDCAGNMNCVFNRINAARTNIQNGQADPATWNDPTLRDAENFAAAGSDALPYGYAAHNSFGTAWYQYFLKQYIYPLFGKHTTPVSDDAYAAGLLGNDFFHQPADKALNWCRQCNSP